MVCEHEYMNISPPNYRACYGPDWKKEILVLYLNFVAMQAYPLLKSFIMLLSILS